MDAALALWRGSAFVLMAMNEEFAVRSVDGLRPGMPVREGAIFVCLLAVMSAAYAAREVRWEYVDLGGITGRFMAVPLVVGEETYLVTRWDRVAPAPAVPTPLPRQPQHLQAAG